MAEAFNIVDIAELHGAGTVPVGKQEPVRTDLAGCRVKLLQMMLFLYFVQEESSYDDWDSSAWEDESEMDLFIAESYNLNKISQKD